MTTAEWHDVMVCTDCYIAHHYGAHEHEGAWYVGESDQPCEAGEPLNRIADDVQVTDNVCSNHEVDDEHPTCPHCGMWGPDDGHDEFSWRQCDGCGSTLGGSRYRLAIWQ